MNKIYLILFALCASNISLYSQENSPQKSSTIFLNGIVDTSKQINRYQEAKAIITPANIVPFKDLQTPKEYSFNTALYYICNLFGKPVNRNEMYMGQNEDIKVAQETCNQQTTPYIIYGLSRGGAVAINAAALNGSQALIMESAPYDIARPTYALKCHLGIPFDHKQLFSYIFPKYDPCQPINAQAIKTIENKDLPIFIIHSQTDSRVDASESLRYYAHFTKEEFKNIYLVRLPEGKHGHVITNPKMAPVYLQALHSFYKAHNLPYVEEYAQFDKNELQKLFQPNICDIEQEIQNDDQKLETIYQQATTRNIIGASLAALLALGLYCYKK